ncbi:hypothetical protein CLV84_2226 [Neolewinella xylanilytica]|uniref:Uncharacterized protein n=1 Tax=Neolewinella xylanilytica TaxID=1514080 RepID=A0A2S6I2M3_9BACT|nr:hypothetical protein [Neolewinella xylanilytica]PPK85331.1 hypothetical protein CLV84_2226 [Neolewinella xylanilytica]
MPILLLLALFLLAGCGTDPAPDAEPLQEPPAAAPYTDRITAAYERLESDSAARQVLRAIEAHGGLEAWYGNGPLYYHFNYQPLDDGSPRNTFVYNDYVNSRTVHHLASDTTQRFGFDGQEAWSTTGDRVAGMSPRFWSLTPYYFVGLPFVLADEGIGFESLPARELDGTVYDLVKVTFADGTGDAPDDYYILYLHPETGQLDALRYIVSYPGYFPDGGHNPEKLMRITGKTKVDGITLPTGYDTYWWADDQAGDHITVIEVTDYAFLPSLEADFFAMPDGGRVFNDLPKQ